MSRLEVLAIVEQVLGRKARRRHLSVGAMQAMQVLVGTFHPGMRYLLDMALAESRMLDGAGGSTLTFDWTGSTTLMEVVQRWADSV
jgi:hypothetical protein